MRSLRQRLAQFDRVPAAPVRRSADRGSAFAGLLDAGFAWDVSSSYLERRAALEGVPHPANCLDIGVLQRLGWDAAMPEHWCVLDTETTGLESGTGTLVFGLGLVHWDAAGAECVQFFLVEPAGEAAMLTALREELARADALLSYNGASFDLPRLRSRLRLQRMDASILDLPHLDLLHPTRRLVRQWLPDARLASIERCVLGRGREGDTGGEFAPEIYRGLQLDGEDIGLAAVMRHNALDVENLLHLSAWIARVVRGGGPTQWPEEVEWAAVRLLAERGEEGEAIERAGRLTRAENRQIRRHARLLRAKLARRRGEAEFSRAELDAWLDEAPHDEFALVELAKLCEHRLGELERAHDCTVRALSRVRDRRALRGESAAAATEELLHRLRRIRRKMGGPNPDV